MDLPIVIGAILTFVLIASAIVSAFRKSAGSLNIGVMIGNGIVGFLEDRYPSLRTVEQPKRSSDPYVDRWLMPEEERRNRMIKGMIIGASVLLTWFVSLSIVLVLFTGERGVAMIPSLIMALIIIVLGLVIAAIQMLRDQT